MHRLRKCYSCWQSPTTSDFNDKLLQKCYLPDSDKKCALRRIFPVDVINKLHRQRAFRDELLTEMKMSQLFGIRDFIFTTKPSRTLPLLTDGVKVSISQLLLVLATLLNPQFSRQNRSEVKLLPPADGRNAIFWKKYFHRLFFFAADLC